MKPLTFSDLISLIKMLDVSKKNIKIKTVGNDYQTIDSELTLLSNQFYHIVNFPQFKLEFVSKNVTNLLGIAPGEMSLKQFFSLIHPYDLPLVLLASKKLIEFLLTNINLIKPNQIIATLDFRLKTSKGDYIRVLNQNGMVSRDIGNRTCKTISLYSDITHFKTSDKMDFDLINYGDPIDFTFPDEELNNISLLFTPREREILSLLATGKNSIEIGEELCISKHTVDTHRRRMLPKSHLCNTAELVAFAVNNHLF